MSMQEIETVRTTVADGNRRQQGDGVWRLPSMGKKYTQISGGVAVPGVVLGNELSSKERDSEDDVKIESATTSPYVELLWDNRNYRLYLLSHLCQHIGDWFVRIGSLLAVERLSNDSGSSLAALVLTNMLPKALLSQVGGRLADSKDRRKVMISLDLLAAVVMLGFLVALAQESLALLYTVSALRSAIAAMYYPATTGIVPLIVTDPVQLKMAVTMNSWAWSCMAIIGGVVAGGAIEYIGLNACFIVDSISFVASAAFMMTVVGTYNVVADGEGRDHRDSHPNTCLNSTRTFTKYLQGCKFAALTLMKSSGSLVWGAEDILGVLYSNEEGDEDETSLRMGALFSVIGFGCLVGPTLSNYFTDPTQPKTIQVSCVVGLAILTLGWFVISTAQSYWFFVLLSFFRVMGSSIIYVNSTLLLQTLSAKDMLGRMLAVEYAMYTMSEAVTATVAGKLDDAGYSKDQIALFAATLGVFVLSGWCVYHGFGQGAAREDFAITPSLPSSLPGVAMEQEDVDIELPENSSKNTRRERRLSRRSITVQRTIPQTLIGQATQFAHNEV